MSSPFSGFRDRAVLLRINTEVKYIWPYPEVLLLPWEMNVQSSQTNKWKTSPQTQITNHFTFFRRNWARGKCKYHSLIRTFWFEGWSWEPPCDLTAIMVTPATKCGPIYCGTYENTTVVCNSSFYFFLKKLFLGRRRRAFKHINLYSDKIFFACIVQIEEFRIFPRVYGSSFNTLSITVTWVSIQGRKGKRKKP